MNYVTLANVVSSGYTNVDWYQCIASVNCCNQELSCNSCKQLNKSLEVSFIPSKYLLIGFSSDAINNLYFLEAIKILGISYKLKGIVCCNGAHMCNSRE